MKSKDKVDAILESLREEVMQFVEEESGIISSTEYEERVLELSKKFAVDLITKSQGKLPKSRNSKKRLPRGNTNTRLLPRQRVTGLICFLSI